VDAELFGHARGAFTGAVGPRAGLFEDANGGSLFLDEVGELSARAQAKLLRALQEREVRRVGENVARPVDARVIAATNRSLPDMAARGLFRDDLLFRLGVVRLRLPPLRDRPEDIPAIARACWTRVARDAACRAVIGPDALARLIAHPWPGNVRELQNVLAGLVLVAPPRGRVTSRHVEAVLVEAGSTRQPPPVSLERARVSCERRTVAAALARHGGRRTAAARELGLSRQGLSKALRRLRLGRDRPHEGVASTRPLQP
jgi:transcriptional regulator with PAS, ATPase and Fis domain